MTFFESLGFWIFVLLAYLGIGIAGFLVVRNESGQSRSRGQAVVNIVAACIGVVGFATHLPFIFFAGWILIGLGGAVFFIGSSQDGGLKAVGG